MKGRRPLPHWHWSLPQKTRLDPAMTSLLMAMLLVPLSTRAADSYIERMIAAAPDEERAISQAYAVYLTAISREPISKDRIDFPRSLVKETTSHFLLERAYYVAPNVLRGFTLSIPKGSAKTVGGRVKANHDLELKEDHVRQGIHVVVLGQRTVEPAGPNRRPGTQPDQSPRAWRGGGG